MIQNMRWVCLPTELSGLWTAATGSGAGLSAAACSVGVCVATSGHDFSRAVCAWSSIPASAGGGWYFALLHKFFDGVAASGGVAASPVFPNGPACCSHTGPPGSSGTAVWDQTGLGDRKRNKTTAALPIVRKACSSRNPCWEGQGLRQGLGVSCLPPLEPRQS